MIANEGASPKALKHAHSTAMSKPHHIRAPIRPALPVRSRRRASRTPSPTGARHPADAPLAGCDELGGGDDADHDGAEDRGDDRDRERAAAGQQAECRGRRRRSPARPCRRRRAAPGRSSCGRPTSRRSMPDLRIAHAVSAMPPAPALANSRVAAWPARLIWVLAQRPMREPPSWATAEKSTMWPRKESTSKTSASGEPRHAAVRELLPDLREVGERRARSARATRASPAVAAISSSALRSGEAAQGQAVLGGVLGIDGYGDGHELQSHDRSSPFRGGCLRLTGAGSPRACGCSYPPPRSWKKKSGITARVTRADELRRELGVARARGRGRRA